MRFGQRLKEARKARGWTQEDLAFMHKTTRQSVTNWERGTSTPSLNRALQFAQDLGFTLDGLESTPKKKDHTHE